MSKIIDTIKNLSYSKLSDMSNESLANLLAKGSKLYKQNIRRLEKKESLAKVSKAFNQNAPRIVERTQKTASKLTRNEMKREIEIIKKELNKQTTSISSTKKFVSKMNEKLGVDITNLSPADWSNIRKKIESGEDEGPYGSEEIIQSYYYNEVENDNGYSNEEEIEELSEEDIIKGFENLNLF